MATLGSIAAQLAAWFDADDTERFPLATRYWCVNRGVEELLRQSQLRWGDQVYVPNLTTSTLPAGQFALPSGFIRPTVLAYYDSADSGQDGYQNLEGPIAYTEFRRRYPDLEVLEADEPEAWTIYGDVAYVAPPWAGGISPTPGPTGARPTMQLRLDYYGLLPELTDPDEGNAVTIGAAAAVFWLAMLVASDFFPGEEGRRGIFEARAEMEVDKLLVEHGHSRSGSTRPRANIRGRYTS